MIVLNLLCDNGHHFEGWFASSEAFRGQLADDLVQCAYCGTSTISQLPSGPHVRRGGSVDSASGDEDRPSAPGCAVAPSRATPMQTAPMQTIEPQAARQFFQQLATMARQAENVGERLPEEARRIHYKEAPARNIRGVATMEETRELLEEGILVLPAPVPPESETH
jgi:hypothetical protein